MPCGGGRAAAACAIAALAPRPAAQPRPFRKHVLAWADVRNGYQHESITHALATIERLGHESGLWDTTIRTDSQPITKQPIQFKTGTGIATGEQFLARNLDLLRRDLLLRRARDRPRRRSSAPTCCRSSVTTARASWRPTPAPPRSSRGRSSARCSAAASTSIPGGSPTPPSWSRTAASPITAHLPPSFVVNDEHYQLKDFSRTSCTCWRASTRRASTCKAPLVHRTDGDFPVAWTKSYGKGRVFYSTLGHHRQLWDEAWMQQMYAAAMKWVLKL